MNKEPEIDYSKEEAERYRMETRKQKTILLRNKTYTVISIIVGLILSVMLVWGLWSWRAANDMSGTVSAKLNSLLDKVDSKSDKLDTILDTLNERVDEIGKGAADSLKETPETMRELRATIVEARQQLKASGDAVARLASLAEREIAARSQDVGRLVNEGERQIKANGDNSAAAIESLNTFIKETNTQTTRILETGAQLIETANPKLVTLLDHADAVTVSLDGTIKAYTPVGVNLAGITDDLHGVTTDGRAFVHKALFPPPVKGFWPNVWRGFKYVLTPAYDAARFYFIVRKAP